MTERAPLVSIVIPVYNGSNYLGEAIDSALKQTYKNIEILVINDGSNDDSATELIALSYGDKIRYFHKENGGLATALNYGIRQMRGEYFSWLSHDDLYEREKIQAQLDLLDSLEDKTTLVTCALILADEKGNEIDRYRPFYCYSEEQLSRPLFALFHGQIGECCLLIHKSHFKRVGVFDETIFTAQDYDLWFRIMRNQKLYFTREPLVKARCLAGQDKWRLFSPHIEEYDRLWIRMLGQLTQQELCVVGGSEYEFYSDICSFLSSTPYAIASNYARARLAKAKFQVLGAQIKDNLPVTRDDLDQVDYSSRDAQLILRETSILLYRLYSHYEALLAEKERQIAPNSVQLSATAIKGWLRKGTASVVRIVFRAFVWILNALHIKQSLKKTGLYKKMKNSGLLLKLSR